jgi:hypothetical protein
MKRIPIYLIGLFIVLGAVACKKNKLKIDTKGGELALLSQPNNIGMIEGFNSSNPAATNDSIALAWNEAINAGMSAGRLQIDWPDIETAEGVYDKAMVEERFKTLSDQGLKIHLLISAYDSEGPDVPAYLNGLDFDDDKVIASFNRLMDWIIPLLANNNGYAISVSNEPDNAFQDDKKLVKKIVKFFKPVRDHIHGINDNIGVSITMNTGNLIHSENDMFKIMREVDYGCFNLYGGGLDQMTVPYTKAQNEANIEDMLIFAGSKNIVIQELGMHSDSELLNSSEQIQRDFFTTFFTFMQKETRIKAAYVFQMVDWSSETGEVLNESYEPETPQWFIDQYGRILETLGLIDYQTGERKLAMTEIINWIGKFN